MEETKEFRSIPQENYNNIFWYYDNNLTVNEEKLLFFILKSIKDETIIEKRKAFEIAIPLKEINAWFGTRENPLAPKRTKEIYSNKKGSVGEKKVLSLAMRREITIKKFKTLNTHIIGYEIDRETGQVDEMLKKGRVFENFNYEKGVLKAKVNEGWANRFLYPELENGVSFISSKEMENYKSKFTFRLERLLKQKIQTGGWKYQLHMPLSILRTIMLDDPNDDYLDHNEFKNKVMKRAIKELNDFSYLSDIEIIGVNHEIYEGGRISFSYTALKKDLELVAPNAAYKEKQISTLIKTGSIAMEKEPKEKISYRKNARVAHRNTNTDIELMEEDIKF